MPYLTDIHCHLLPYVDDGAQNLQEAKALLQAQQAQGVGTVCLTPHWRADMFETPHEKIQQQYLRLAEYAATLQNPLALRLGREYYCDKTFLQHLAAGHVLPIEGTQCVLIEFSPHRHTSADLCAGVATVKVAGFTPIIAHVERYQAVRQDTAILQELTAMGAYCQMNTEGLLGKMGIRERWFCQKLLKEHSAEIALLASDAHRLNMRSPNLGDCAKVLRKKLPPSQWQALFVENPNRILGQI